MTRFRAMRDTLGYEIAILAIGMPAAIIGLILITTPGALS